MSTYYYLVCDEHRTGVGACTSVGGGGSLGEPAELPAFVYEHRTCAVRIQHEHDWADLRETGYVRFHLEPNE